MMTIQFNTDNNIAGTEDLRADLNDSISESLARFSHQITRLEVHLADENSSSKTGQNDKKCMLEARLKGMQPIAVTNVAGSIEQAVTGAVNKLKTSLDTVLGRLANH